jgi:hypothetical protein
MTSPIDNETIAAPRPTFREESKMAGNKIDIALTATLNRTTNQIDISGPSGPFPVGKDNGPCQFDFTLTDSTNLTVEFSSLDAADNLGSQCPPAGSGDKSTQINGVNIHNNANPKSAGFNDKNDNDAKNGPMNVSFRWNFTCEDPSVTVGSYDPIISNGGKTFA